MEDSKTKNNMKEKDLITIKGGCLLKSMNGNRTTNNKGKMDKTNEENQRRKQVRIFRGKQAEFFIFLQNELRIRLSVPQMKKMTSFKNVLAVVSSLDPATSAPTSPKDKK